MNKEEYLYKATRGQSRSTAYKIFQEDKKYIKSPSDAPAGANVQKGKRGGLYYDTEGKTFRQDRIQLDESGIFEAVEAADYFIMEGNLEEFKSMLPDMHDGDLAAMRQAVDSIARRNPEANSFASEVLEEAKSRGLDTRLDPVPVGEVDAELISTREQQLRDLAASQDSLTFYHATYPENTEDILKQGMIPGKKQPAAQDFQPKYLGNYMFTSEQGALLNYENSEGNIDILKIDIPLNEDTIPLLARNLHPDEDSHNNAFAPIEQTLDMSVAYSDDIPPEWISVQKKAKNDAGSGSQDTKPQYETYHPQQMQAQPSFLSESIKEADEAYEELLLKNEIH